MSSDSQARKKVASRPGLRSDSPAPSSVAISMYLETAMDAIGREDFDTAVATLNRAIVDAGDVQLAECYSLRGFVRLKLEQFELADDDCSEAIRRRGNDPETLAWRAAARAELGKWREAFSDLHLASLADPNKGGMHIRTMQSWLPNAVSAMESGLSDQPKSIPHWFDRGWIYLLANQIDEAKKDFNKVLKLDSNHGGACIGLARVALQENDLATAVRMASQAMQADPESTGEALACRAEAYARQGQLSFAIEDVTRLREKTADGVEGLLLCASLRERLGDVSGAIGDLNIALRLKPDLPVVLAARGDAYARVRNYEMALADYTQYLEYVPGDERVWLKALRYSSAIGTSRTCPRRL